MSGPLRPVATFTCETWRFKIVIVASHIIESAVEKQLRNCTKIDKPTDVIWKLKYEI